MMVKTGLPIEENPWNAVSTLLVLLIDCLAAAAMTPNGIDTMVAALSQDNIDERTMYIALKVASKKILCFLAFGFLLQTDGGTKPTNNRRKPPRSHILC